MNPINKENHGPLLQIFNRSLGTGGEELAVRLVARMLEPECAFRECIFQSSGWTGPAAPSILGQAARMFHNPRALRTILEAQREHRAEAWLLHNFIPVVSAGVYRLAIQERIPIIQFVHNFRPYSVNSYSWVGRNLDPVHWRANFIREVFHASWQNSHLKTAWLACLLTTMHALRWFRGVKAWVAVSDFMRRQFLAAGVPPADVFTLRHAWMPMAQPPSSPEGDYYLFLGRLIEEKGLKVLVQTWKQLRGQMGGRCPRLVIGGEGPLKEWLIQETKGLPQIEYRGVVVNEEKHNLLAGCRALIVPSVWWEPLGLVAYEAYDYGKPVLAAASGGLTELVQDGTTGRLHRPGESEQLTQQIMALNEATDLRREMGMAGRKWLLINADASAWKKRFFEIVAHARSA